MEPSGKSHASSRDNYMIVVLCLIVGVPLFVFLNILTGGLFLILAVSAVVIAVLGAFHYFLWGRAFTRETVGEREEEELRARAEAQDWPYDEPSDSERSGW